LQKQQKKNLYPQIVKVVVRAVVKEIVVVVVKTNVLKLAEIIVVPGHAQTVVE
jgi:hypothetical protein